jgi:hypothetical protein
MPKHGQLIKLLDYVMWQHTRRMQRISWHIEPHNLLINLPNLLMWLHKVIMQQIILLIQRWGRGVLFFFSQIELKKHFFEYKIQIPTSWE